MTERPMTEDSPWDLLVLGGGTAGIVGAKTAASLGARVVLVERDRTGGDCLWTGCVPSKALLAAAHATTAGRGVRGLGVSAASVRVDFDAVMAHVRSAIHTIEPVDSPEALAEAGVTVIHGDAVFAGPNSIAVGGRTVRFAQALVAAGARPAVPGIPGLAEAAPLTSDTVWDLTALPDRLVVMGGGSIGVELGQAFARLGSTVTLVEALPRILAQEDPQAAALVRDALVADGVEVLTGHRVTCVSGEPGRPGTITVEAEAGARDIGYDSLLVAVGRTPRSRGLGLEKADVVVDHSGFVVVDDLLRTSNTRIWAAGDITELPQLTHMAGVGASLAASNAVLGLRRKVDLTAVPRVTYTDPEVAAVGAASWSDGGAPSPRTVTRDHADVDRAVAEGRTDGFSTLVLDSRRRVIGGTIVGPRAGESLAEVVLAVRQGLSTSDLAGTIHAYPTYGDGVWNAAIDDVQDWLAAPRTRAVTERLVRVRRAWLARRGPARRADSGG